MLNSDETYKPFSGTFSLPAGEMLLVQAELAAQLPELLGKSYRDIRSAMGVKTRGERSPDLAMTDDGYAVISMIGPVTRYDTFCTDLFGGVSVDSLSSQLQEAALNPAVKGVLLMVDSPGGQAAGIHDLADMIYQMRDTKPVVAYVDNLAASAAYWVASAANVIVMSPAAFVGSIGVVTTVGTETDPKSVEIVSSKSPKKRPDVTKDDGRAQIQERIDDLADVFISTVAKHRGVETSTVESDFGQGGVAIASKAVSAGMADYMGDAGEAMNQLKQLYERSTNDQNKYGLAGPRNTQNGAHMANLAVQTAATVAVIATAVQLKEHYPSLVAEIEAQSAQAERDRIKAIDGIDTAENRAIAGDLFDSAKFDGKTTAGELALSIVQLNAKRKTDYAANRQEDAAAIPKIQETPPAARDGITQEHVASGIAAYANERRKLSGGGLMDQQKGRK